MKDIRPSLLAIIITFLLPTYQTYAEPLRICRPNNMVSALGYTAEQYGFFSKHGIETDFQTSTNGKICLDSVIAGRSDIAFTAEGPLVYMAHQKPAIKVLARLGQVGETGLALSVNSENTGLKGKKIGVLPGTVSLILMDKVLKSAGLNVSDVSLVSLQAPAMPVAFASGMVDAISIWEPWLTQGRRMLKSPSVVLGREPSLYKWDTLLIASDKSVHSKREQIEKFLLAIKDASDYIHSNPPELKKVLAESLAMPVDILDENWKLYTFTIDLNRQSIQLMQEDEQILRQLTPRQFPAELTDYSVFFDPSVLRAIIPEAVQW
jgi:sulfonate transport system substrate-binding protein